MEMVSLLACNRFANDLFPAGILTCLFFLMFHFLTFRTVCRLKTKWISYCGRKLKSLLWHCQLYPTPEYFFGLRVSMFYPTRLQHIRYLFEQIQPATYSISTIFYLRQDDGKVGFGRHAQQFSESSVRPDESNNFPFFSARASAKRADRIYLKTDFPTRFPHNLHPTDFNNDF